MDRRLGLTLRWRTPSQEGAILIGVVSIHPSATAWGACYCAAPAAAGSFTIPPAALANLSPSQAGPTLPAPSLWLSCLPNRNRQSLHASGLDNGLAISPFVQVLEAFVR